MTGPMTGPVTGRSCPEGATMMQGRQISNDESGEDRATATFYVESADVALVE